MEVGLLGFGLIGASIARALAIGRDASEPILVRAWSPSLGGPRRAVEAGWLDEASPDPASAIARSELVVLAAPPLAILDLLTELGPSRSLAASLSADATVTDVASTKTAIVARADAAGLHFVGGHPMAGRETTGWAAGDAELFLGRPWVVVPGRAARDSDRRRVEWLADTCGARPVTLDPEQHDEAAAAISHLPLVLAAALVELVVGRPGKPARPVWPVASELAASGWQGAVRLARGAPEMAAGIAATNAEAIGAAIRELQGVLDEWLAALDGPDGPDAQALEARFRSARERLAQ